MSTASLDAAAATRKERLSQLKSLKRKQPSVDEQQQSDTTSTVSGNETPNDSGNGERDISHLLSGRNYDAVERAPKMGFVTAPNEGQTTLEEVAAKIAEQTLEARKEAEAEDKPIDLFKLQPKKPNWDLKRDVDKKLERLNSRTDMAIARLIKARIEEQKKEKAKKAGGATMEEGAEMEGNLDKIVQEREKEQSEQDEDDDDMDESN